MKQTDRNPKLIVRFLRLHRLIEPYTLKTAMFQVKYQAVKGNFLFYQSRKTNAAIKQSRTCCFLNLFPKSKCLRPHLNVSDLSGRCRMQISPRSIVGWLLTGLDCLYKNTNVTKATMAYWSSSFGNGKIFQCLGTSFALAWQKNKETLRPSAKMFT